MNTYKYDLHVHTDETSPCGKVKASEGVRMYKEAGYYGIVITDHYFDGFFENLSDMSWKDKVDCYLDGYKRAYAKGLEIGLKVILGMEIRFLENLNDYLVYGLEENFIYEHPELYKLDLAGFRNLLSGTGIMVFQAHPYRSGLVRADPALLDGVEIFNGNPRHNSLNEKAELFASKHNLIGISGSDFHQPQDLARGGMLLTESVETSKELADVLKSGKFSELVRI